MPLNSLWGGCQRVSLGEIWGEAEGDGILSVLSKEQRRRSRCLKKWRFGNMRISDIADSTLLRGLGFSELATLFPFKYRIYIKTGLKS